MVLLEQSLCWVAYTAALSETMTASLSVSLPEGHHARPFEPYPKEVLGAVRTFLEPFRGHLSPKVIKIFKN